MDLYHYTSSGLDYIWLKNGFKYKQTIYGDGLSIHNIFGLHQAIGRYLIFHIPIFTGIELRFLRKEMDFSQAGLAELLGISESTIRNWEKGCNQINGSPERLLRILYREHINSNGEIRSLIEKIAKIDRDNYHQHCELETTESGWKAAA